MLWGVDRNDNVDVMRSVLCSALSFTVAGRVGTLRIRR